jgi:copper chaperone
MTNINQTFQVQGMTCGHCVKAVTEAVRGVDADAEVKVDLATGRVEVRSGSDREQLAQAIRDEGYTVAAA